MSSTTENADQTIARSGVVIPCYNEAERLQQGPLLEALSEDSSLNFLFVNDGSRDATEQCLERLCQGNPEQARILSLPTNRGKAEAVRQGMLQLLADGYDVLGYWDADLATPLHYIQQFRSRLLAANALMVFGSRTRLLGHRIERRGSRHYIGRGFATFAGLALGAAVYDTQCGAKLFRNSAVLAEALAVEFRTRWCFDVELFLRLGWLLQKTGRRLDQVAVEYPLEAWRDVAGSKLSLSDAPSILGEMLTLARLRKDPFGA